MSGETRSGSDGHFPTTRWSAIAGARSKDPAERSRASDSIANVYWKPIYKYIRVKWQKSSEDAKDLTQGFFARALEKDFFGAYDSSKARFRTFIRVCVDGYISNEDRAVHRSKRGGDYRIESVDFENAEREIDLSKTATMDSMEDYFYREWVRSLFSLVVETLRQECTAKMKTVQFEIFERHDLEGDSGTDRPSYETLAKEFNLPVSQVTNYLAFARREFRRIMLDRLREITASDEEFRKEARWIQEVNLK